MSPFWKTYQEKLAGGLAQATLWLCTGIFLLGSGLVPSSNLQIRILLLGIGCVLLILAAVGAIPLIVRLFSSRKEVHPADTCIYCRQATGDIVSHLGPGNLTRDWAGREAYIYKCSNPKCGKQYGREIKAAASYEGLSVKH
jgi:hypothetical protein